MWNENKYETKMEQTWSEKYRKKKNGKMISKNIFLVYVCVRKAEKARENKGRPRDTDRREREREEQKKTNQKE